MQQPGPEQQDMDTQRDEATAQEAPTPPREQQSADTQQDKIIGQNASTSSLEQQLAEAQQRQQECLDALLRSQADFINYKRRALQERAEARVAAQEEALMTLLPVLDDLGRALESTPPELAEEPWVQGLHLVARRLRQTLQQLSVRQIGASGEPFDPRWHEAVMTEQSADLPAGTVVQVTRPGYALGERVLRPAQVVVATPDPTEVMPTEG
jgi:molecular chaperone GrpE